MTEATEEPLTPEQMIREAFEAAKRQDNPAEMVYAAEKLSALLNQRPHQWNEESWNPVIG